MKSAIRSTANIITPQKVHTLFDRIGFQLAIAQRVETKYCRRQNAMNNFLSFVSWSNDTNAFRRNKINPSKKHLREFILFIFLVYFFRYWFTTNHCHTHFCNGEPFVEKRETNENQKKKKSIEICAHIHDLCVSARHVCACHSWNRYAAVFSPFGGVFFFASNVFRVIKMWKTMQKQ